jgi:glycosyltransferase involved in cell wall biosynthesis
MLSICIPLYNFDVNELISKLYIQSKKLNIDTEIVVLDDFSTQKYDISPKPGFLKIIRLEKNIGRSCCRNLLATYAQYDNLLFLDCDSMPSSDDFLANYIKQIPNYKVSCGGTSYEHNNPRNLRIKFGTKRETRNTNQHFFF